MSKQLAIITRRWPALPRSTRRRAAASVSGRAAVAAATNSPVINTLEAAGHTHDNKAALDTLAFDLEGFLTASGRRARVGYADEASHAAAADLAADAENARQWDHHDFDDYLDQPVRRGDSPQFAGISSGDFDPSVGALGAGFGLYKDPDTGHYHLIIDDLSVRGGMSVTTMYIQEIKATAGIVVVSQAAGKIERVESLTDNNGRDYYHLYLKDQARALQFQPGDLVRCARWQGVTATGADGSFSGAMVRYYWVRVNYIDPVAGWISVWADEFPSFQVVLPNPDTLGTDIVTKHFVPEVDDELVLMGNDSPTSGRDGFLYITSENGRPRIMAYKGVNTPSLTTGRRLVLGDLSGMARHDGSGTLDGYGLWADNVHLRGSFTLDTDDEYNGKEVYSAIKAYFNIAAEAITMAIKKDELTAAGMSITTDGINFIAERLALRNKAGENIFNIDSRGNVCTRSAWFNDFTGRRMMDINIDGNGYIVNYYPSGRKQSEIGYDGNSFIRVFEDNKAATLLWKIGNPAQFQREGTIVSIDLVRVSDVNGTVPFDVDDTQAVTYYYRYNNPDQLYTNESMGAGTSIPAGSYTRPGLARVVNDQEGNPVYVREILTVSGGEITSRRLVYWRYNEATDSYIQTTI